MNKKVKFNDNWVWDGYFETGKVYEVTPEQYEVLLKQGCGYDKTKPLITDVDAKKEKEPKP
jgi:hypothetical protein